MLAKLSSQKHSGRDSVFPYKIAIILLYENAPGCHRTDAGAVVLNYAEFKRYLGRAKSFPVPYYLQILRDMGLVEMLQLHRTYAIIKMKGTIK